MNINDRGKQQPSDSLQRMLDNDPYLKPFANSLKRRMEKIRKVEERLTQGKMSLADFAAGHEYFGLHFRNGEWVFREWAPNATRIYLIGEMTGWREKKDFELKRTTEFPNCRLR